MARFSPVVMGVTGLGGYAGGACVHVQACGCADDPVVKLAAVCEPDLDSFPELADRLRTDGVTVLDSFEKLLEQPIEALWLPLPIDLHAPFTIRALEAGKAVLCEKPAAGCVDDVDAMIAARDRAKRPVLIGYQDIYDSTTLPLKRLLLEGRIGTVRSAVSYAAWPRDDAYFTRNTWAGRFKRRDTWVLDSPVNNAMSHYVNLPLFLLGASLETSAEPLALEAELYRAHPIENFDTASIRVTLPGGVTLLILFTHAVGDKEGPQITIRGDRGRIEFDPGRIVVHADGSDPVEMRRDGRSRFDMMRRLAQAVRGQVDGTIAGATLEVARAQSVVASGASQAAPITPVPPRLVKLVPRQEHTFRAVGGLLEAMRTCAGQEKMLHESGLLPWTTPASRLDLRGYHHFAGPAGALNAAAASPATTTRR